ncbi:ABC-2 type transport system permease protein [Evansella caseinilytica]|uniref:ABC-2 type transport system permease protein n=1 Tax=Evansella caseinilytica TaxID=1503961 RepID=A0A1H3SSA0_9BACI|nr:ABC transporter permease [Evansella caseinilytica]SDZ40896.1 ABC-2 type transport system permease protein [Evansella caseinilytica]
MFRFMLRRDRVQLPVWILGIVLPIVGTLAAYESLYSTAAERQESAAMMSSPAAISMTGPEFYLEDYTLGAMMGHQMLGFMGIVVALMSVLLIVRHTRKEEETGRTELVRASVTGRHANTTAVLMLAVAVNLVVALVVAVGLGATGAESITWEGSFLYGAALAVIGLAFSGLTLLFVQLLEHARGAIGISTGMIAIAYTLRAIGDMGEEFFSWISPIGWAQQTAVYLDNLWWPLFIGLAFFLVMAAIAYPLSTKRDVGAGMIPPRRGKASASAALTNPLGLAYRLQRTNLIVWSFAMLLFGIAYGSFLGEADKMIESIGDYAEEMLPALEGISLADSFAAMFISIASIVATIPALQSILRLRGEEKEGRLDGMLAGALSRYRLLGSYVAAALINTMILLFMAGLGMGIAGSQSMDNSAYLTDLMIAGLSYTPALWVVIGVAVALIGLVPRATSFSWAVLVFAFLVIYLGGALQMPEWVMKISPYQHIARFPAEEFNWVPLFWLTAIAAALIAVGMYSFRRRDISM